MGASLSAGKPRKLTLVYAKMQALAEPARMTAAHAGIKIDADVYPWEHYDKPWSEAKLEINTINKLVPVLVVEEEGKTTEIGMSNSICRYLAAIGNKLPPTPEEMAVVDSVGEWAHELFMPLNPCVNGFKFALTDEKKKEALDKVKAKIDLLEPYMARLKEQRAKASLSTDGPFVMGKEAYYCDFHVFHHVDLALMLDATILEGKPLISALMEAVPELDGVKEYMSSRPKLTDPCTEDARLGGKTIGFAP